MIILIQLVLCLHLHYRCYYCPDRITFKKIFQILSTVFNFHYQIHLRKHQVTMLYFRINYCLYYDKKNSLDELYWTVIVLYKALIISVQWFMTL